MRPSNLNLGILTDDVIPRRFTIYLNDWNRQAYFDDIVGPGKCDDLVSSSARPSSDDLMKVFDEISVALRPPTIQRVTIKCLFAIALIL